MEELKKVKSLVDEKTAFTLAEVLITLGVIGIVAALTIPNLVQSYKKKVVETKLVKFYSMMNNAIKLAEVDYGPQSTWTDYHIDNHNDEQNNPIFDRGDKYDAVVNKYFAPYLKITGSEEITDINTPQKLFYLSDGSAFSYALHENREIRFYPDNPKKCLKSNDATKKCIFMFVFLPTASERFYNDFKYNLGNGMQPNLYSWDGNEESLGCNKSKKEGYCEEVIRRNGWKIPEDYPYKF